MAIDLAKLLAREFARNGEPIGVRSATLHKIAPGTRTPGSISAGTNPATTTHACKAYVDETEQATVEAEGSTSVKQSRATVGIFGASIVGGVVPAVNDKLTIGGVTYRLTKVVGDGVGAVYEFEGTK